MSVAPGLRGQELRGQTVVVIGGSAGIGLATAREVRAAGGDIILAARNPGRLAAAAEQIQPLSTAAFDATDHDALQAFFEQLERRVDHVMVSAGGSYYAPLAEIDFARARREFDEHVVLMLDIARRAVNRVRAGGTLIFMGGTGPGARGSASESPRRSRRRSRPWPPTWRSRSLRSASTSSPPGSSTRRSRRGSSATRSTRAAPSCARASRSGAWSGRPTSQRSRCTS